MTWMPEQAAPAIEAPEPWPKKLVEPPLEWVIGSRPDVPGRNMQPAVRPTYIHPNGFVKIHLGYDEVASEHLTLHVWHGITDPCIHNHRWGLASRILQGRLRNTLYDFEPCTEERPDAVLPYQYLPTKLGLEYSLEEMGEQSGGLLLPKVISRQVYSAGETYRQASALFHAASSGEDTITLMTRTLHRQPTAIIMRTPDCPKTVDGSVALAEMDPREKLSICRQVLRQL